MPRAYLDLCVVPHTETSELYPDPCPLRPVRLPGYCGSRRYSALGANVTHLYRTGLCFMFLLEGS